MAKTPRKFSFLRDMTTHQPVADEGANCTRFRHYVGGLGRDCTQASTLRREDAYNEQVPTDVPPVSE